MAVHSETMKRFIVGEGKLVESLLGRIALVVLFSVTFSLALTLLFLINKGVAPHVLKFTVVAAAALATGLQARGLLKQNTFVLRYTVALTALILSLGILKPLTQGFIGIDLFAVFPEGPDVDGATQLLLGAALIWLAQRAWSAKGSSVAVSPVRAPRPARISASPRIKKRNDPAAGGAALPSVLTAAYWQSLWAKRRNVSLRPISQILKPPRDWTTGRGSAPLTKIRKSRKTKARKQSGRKAADSVHLSKVIEHRCPYCLELVKSGDSRGVKTCKVCKTKHHADCWDITGVCQIPHKHI